MTVRHVYIIGLALQSVAAVRALQYYRRNPNG